MSQPRATRFIRDLADWAAPQGWTYSVCGSGHLRWMHPDVPKPVFTAKTPTIRSGHEERAKLRRALVRSKEGAHAG